VNGQTTSWTINPHGTGGLSQALVETAPGGAKKYFVYGPTGLLYDVDSAATPNVRHYHTDQVGSTVALTDQSGAVIGRVEYSAYGMVSYREGDTNTPFLYNGAYGVMTDAESGLLNMRARYYPPWIGHFASPDPVGFSGGLNWYAFAEGNPVSFADPLGLWQVTIGGGVEYGGVFTFGNNGGNGIGGQWNVAAYVGTGAGFYVNINPFDSGKKQENAYIGVTVKAGLGSGAGASIGGTGYLGELGNSASVAGRIGSLSGGFSTNGSPTGPQISLGGGVALVFRTRNSYTKRVASSIFSGWHDPFEFFRRATNKNENSEA